MAQQKPQRVAPSATKAEEAPMTEAAAPVTAATRQPIDAPERTAPEAAAPKPAPQPAPMPPQKAADLTADASEAAAEADDAGSEVAKRLRSGFVRVPFGAQQQKLAYPVREGFHRHWFNDFPGRIEQAMKAGYTNVEQNGAPVSRPVGTREGGGALIAYLMEIPEEWFQEDQAMHQARVDEIDRAIGAGNVEPERRQQGYIPQTGITIKSTQR